MQMPAEERLGFMKIDGVGSIASIKRVRTRTHPVSTQANECYKKR